MNQPKKVYGSHVSRVLSRHGFRRFESESTSVRGYSRYYTGYRAMGERAAWDEGYTDSENTGAVVVTHEQWDHLDDTDHRPRAEKVAEALDAYQTALEDAGFAVTRASNRLNQSWLIVTAPTEETR